MTRIGSDQRLSPVPDEAPRFGDGWPRFLDPGIAKPRDGRALVSALAVAIAFDLALRSGLVGVAGALAIAVASVALVASGRLRTRTSVVLAACAPVFGVWLVLRASAWLFPLDVIAACGLVVLACSLGSGGSLWDLSIPRVIARAVQAVVQAILSPVFLFAGRRAGERRAAGIVRGVLITIPVLLVLGALLASADAVFKSFVNFDLGDVIMHVVALAFGVFAMGALLRLASVDHVDVPVVRGPKLGPQEWTVVLGLLNVMFGAFAVARIVALSEGGRRVITSAGLTYAEYARSGFFQLLAAAVVAIGVVAAVRATAEIRTDGERTRFRVLALGVVGLVGVMVVSAFHRLFLYEQAFGLTMLRVYAQAAIVWVGLVLAFLALSIAGLGRRRVWVWSAAGIAALALLFAMNVLNPERFVVRHNVAHQRTTSFDPSYLDELSDDAAPELALHPELRARVCVTGAEQRDRMYAGWAAYNVAHQHAKEIRARVCGTTHATAQGG